MTVSVFPAGAAAVPGADHICTGSEHGTTCYGWAGAPFRAFATPLACCLADRTLAFPPASQAIRRRGWLVPDELAAWSRRIDDSGQRFL